MAALCGSAVRTLYLRRGVIVVHVAGVHILCHDDEGQEVWGAERARAAAKGEGQREKPLHWLGGYAKETVCFRGRMWRVSPYLE